MTNPRESLDAAFIEAKRRELLKLRETLRQTADAAEHEEGLIKGASTQQSREYEDDAQKLDTLELEGRLVNHSVERLARVDRALAKIDAGTYGFSDLSGERIPDERLNAIPDAINTLREQQESER